MLTTEASNIPLVVFQHRNTYVETSVTRQESGVFVVGNKLDRLNGKVVGVYKAVPIKQVYEIFVEVALIIDQLIAEARRIEDQPRYEQHDTEAWINIRRNLIRNDLGES